MEAKKYQVLAVLFLFFFSFPASFAQRATYNHINLPKGVVGPETIVFDCKGKGPYVSVSDGRILKWQGSSLGWTEFARTRVLANRSESCNTSTIDTSSESSCGRPLGLKFHPSTCELYIADAYFGLMKVDREGGIAKIVVNQVNGLPLKFTNDLDIDPETGVIYFTDTSMQYSRWEYLLVVLTKDRTGRLLKYDPEDHSVSVLLGGLAFPNGVALSKDRSFLLVAETTTGQIRKFWLSGPKINRNEIFVQLGGWPDNVNRNADGDFWVAQDPTLPSLSDLRTRDKGRPVKIDSSGKILKILDNTGSTSDVNEFNNKIWIGSLSSSYITIE